MTGGVIILDSVSTIGFSALAIILFSSGLTADAVDKAAGVSILGGSKEVWLDAAILVSVGIAEAEERSRSRSRIILVITRNFSYFTTPQIRLNFI
jgi:hypothetical protein